MIEILDLINITLSYIKQTFAVHTYILFAQNQVEVVELANKCIRQIDAALDLYNSKKEINNRKD